MSTIKNKHKEDATKEWYTEMEKSISSVLDGSRESNGRMLAKSSGEYKGI